MDMLKIQSLREMTRDELSLKKTELLDERFNLRMRLSLKQLDNPLRLRQIRRDIAKINTILNEDALGLIKLAESTTTVLDDSKAKKTGEEK